MELSTNINIAAEALTTHAEAAGTWAEEMGLRISAHKSSVINFTPDTKQSHHQPPATISGALKQLERQSRLLGVMIDPPFTCRIQARVMKERTA